jgi:hypothetical protein
LFKDAKKIIPKQKIYSSCFWFKIIDKIEIM